MKKIINSLLSKTTGHHLTRSATDEAYDFLSSSWVKSLNINTVLDVGANGGQFASCVRRAMPLAQIISFEPTPKEVVKIRQLFTRDPNFKVIETAVGESKYTSQLRLNEFTPASSLLDKDPELVAHFSAVGETTNLEIKVNTLDDILKEYKLSPNVLLKIDVQGYECKVIEGAKGTLEKVDMVFVECNFISMYKNQALFDDIYNALRANGFEFRALVNQLSSGKNAAPIQADAIFIKKSL